MKLVCDNQLPPGATPAFQAGVVSPASRWRANCVMLPDGVVLRGACTSIVVPELRRWGHFETAAHRQIRACKQEGP